MTTLRETYIEGLMAVLEAVPGFPAGVHRSISVAFRREESPVLVVHRGGEDVANSLGDDTDRFCEILVSVISRGDTPDRDADAVMELAHPAIMQFLAPGLIQMEEVGTNAPVFSNADGHACMMTTRYKVHYCTDRLSLSA
ncbi:MAG TPA: hypothetical protein VIN36_01125 [Thiobacillus sp.]